jgi:hypothetical protein
VWPQGESFVRQPNTDDLTVLLGEHRPPCLTLIQRTHRHGQENQQDPIKYRNLLRELETSLLAKYPAREVRPLVEKFQALGGDSSFWNHRTEGLAVFGSPEGFHIFDLQQAVKDLVVAADSFHVKPLLRALQSADRFQVLALNRHEAKLYEGSREALDLVETPNVPSTITEALGDELTDPHQTVASYGLGAGGGGKAMHHGHGAKMDEVEIDMLRFFRAIDRGVLEHHSRPSGLPLMLAALPENESEFRGVSHNPFLMSEGLSMNPEALSADALREKAWEVMEPVVRKRLADRVERYQVARSRELGSDVPAEVAMAVVAGRVGTLLIEGERQIPGRLNTATGRIELGELTDPTIDDVLDDLAEAVLRKKGEVVVVPAEHMPSGTGMAASFRF